MHITNVTWSLHSLEIRLRIKIFTPTFLDTGTAFWTLHKFARIRTETVLKMIHHPTLSDYELWYLVLDLKKKKKTKTSPKTKLLSIFKGLVRLTFSPKNQTNLNFLWLKLVITYNKFYCILQNWTLIWPKLHWLLNFSGFWICKNFKSSIKMPLVQRSYTKKLDCLKLDVKIQKNPKKNFSAPNEFNSILKIIWTPYHQVFKYKHTYYKWMWPRTWSAPTKLDFFIKVLFGSIKIYQWRQKLTIDDKSRAKWTRFDQVLCLMHEIDDGYRSTHKIERGERTTHTHSRYIVRIL